MLTIRLRKNPPPKRIEPEPLVRTRACRQAALKPEKRFRDIDEEIRRLENDTYSTGAKEDTKLDTGIFDPPVEIILWRRERREGEAKGETEYLVKLKGRSYLHCEWVLESELMKKGRQLNSS